MKPLLLHSNADTGVTLLTNIFIDDYLPRLSGLDVKIYLLLLRHLDDASGILSIKTISLMLQCPDEDTLKSLNALEKLRLLSLSRDGAGEICSIRFETPLPADAITDSPEAIPLYVPAESASDRKEYGDLTFVCEKYLGRAFSHVDADILHTLYHTLGLSAAMIEYAVEYCVERGHASMRYIETVATSWHTLGLKTPAEVRNYFHSQNQFYKLVFNTFGIGGRAPADSEKQSMDKWMSYGFSDALIKEAINQTLDMTHKVTFSYVDKILENWRKNSVKTLDDVAALNEAFALRRKEQEKLENAITYGKPRRPQNSFSAFGQRNTSDEDLQKKLLGLH